MRRLAMFVVAITLSASALWADAPNCNREHSHFGDDMETYVSQENFSIPMGGEMQVTAARNGGVRLLQGSSSEYEVTVCKYAGADSESEGNQILGQIKAEHSSNSISVRGPEGMHWSASLIIRVPQGANMSVSAHNGPVSAKHVSGNFRLDTVNGPIAVEKVTGKVTATAKNGPISFEGNEGDYDLQTQNGPISIELENQSWQNGKLDAKANNGPVSLNLPKGYQSGVVVTSDGHAPMSCEAEVCREARKTWDDNGKKIEFGSGATVIRISTHNGPVSVGNDRHEAEM